MIARWRRTPRRKRWLLFITAGILTLFYFSQPERLFTAPVSYVLEDRNGELLNATIAADGQWRFPESETVPQKFEDCITAFEDRRFFYHPGVDPFALLRAVLHNSRRQGGTQGGSTISMQVIRLALQHRNRSIWIKLKESLLAIRLECRYSKKKILALYASHAPFGGNVVGLEAASWRYYGIPASRLSWGQMATLAVLPNAPALVHPGKNRDALLRKRNRLLDRLRQQQILSAEDCSLAKQEPLPGIPLPLPQHATHLFQRCKSLTTGMPQSVIRTTLDLALQKNTATILNRHQSVFRGNGINNACALILEVESGQVLAYAGNIAGKGDPEMESEVDVIAAPRSPGSALKPILYAAMLSDGMLLPDALIPDVPMQIGSYAPQNFDRGYDGAVPASAALARSLNIPALKMLQQFRYPRLYDLLQQTGITTLQRPAGHYGLSLVLGGCEVTMWDLAGVYASMARSLNRQDEYSGQVYRSAFHPPQFLLQGLQTQRPAASGNASMLPLDAVSLWFTFSAMREVMRPGEEGLWQQFGSAQPIAWKTGTSFGFRDGWAIGVTPRYVVAVWVGNTDGEGRPELMGIKTAAPVMFDLFRLLPSGGWFRKPNRFFSRIPVCRESGYRAGPDCPNTDTLQMPPQAEKSPLCPYHRIIHLDASGEYRATEACESPLRMQHVSWFVLTPSMEYYYRQHTADYKPMPPFKPGCNPEEATRVIDILYPVANGRIYVPLEMNGERGKTIFSAAHRRPGARLFWSIDDQFAGTTEHFHQIALQPAPGKHILTVVDEEGVSVSRSFEITEKENRE